MLLDITVD
jgi:hypothetical protein